MVALAGLEKKGIELAMGGIEGSPMAVDSPVVGGGEVSREVEEGRRVVFDYLVSLLGGRVEEFVDPRRFGNFVVESLYSLDCYHLADYFRLLRLLVEEGREVPMGVVDGLTAQVVRIDEPRADCDENKAELIALLYSLVRKNEEIAKHIASQTAFCVRFLAIHISTRSSEHYLMYNTRCLSLFYELLAFLLAHNNDLKNSFKVHPNVRFAMEQFFLSREYPGIASSLLKLCIQLICFTEFREMAFSVLLRGCGTPVSVPLMRGLLQEKQDVEMFCLGGGLGVVGALLQEFHDLSCEGAVGCATLLKEVCFRIQRFVLLFFSFFVLFCFNF